MAAKPRKSKVSFRPVASSISKYSPRSIILPYFFGLEAFGISEGSDAQIIVVKRDEEFIKDFLPFEECLFTIVRVNPYIRYVHRGIIGSMIYKWSGPLNGFNADESSHKISLTPEAEMFNDAMEEFELCVGPDKKTGLLDGNLEIFKFNWEAYRAKKYIDIKGSSLIIWIDDNRVKNEKSDKMRNYDVLDEVSGYVAVTPSTDAKDMPIGWMIIYKLIHRTDKFMIFRMSIPGKEKFSDFDEMRLCLMPQFEKIESAWNTKYPLSKI